MRAYFWAALLPVGALAVKVGWDFIQTPRRRETYLWCCLGLGLLGVLTWAAAYACVYPTLSKGVNEQIASMSVFDNHAAATGLNFAGSKWVDVLTVGSQAVAEIFLSAVLGMYLTSLYSRHRRVRLAYDPAYTQLEAERSELEAAVARERSGLGEAAGHLAFAASRNHDPHMALQALAERATVLPNSPSSLFLEATAHDTLHQFKDAERAYRAFLALAGGKYPDQEFQARHRLIALEHER